MSEAHVVIVGAGGHAKVVISTLRAAGRRVDAIVDDDDSLQHTHVLGVPVVGTVDMVTELGPLEAVIAVGDNLTRRRIALCGGMNWTTVVHPSAVVDPSVALGPGTVVFAGAVIQSGATIGAHVIVNTSASVDHECIVGDFAHIGPGAQLGGTVEIGEGAFVGLGATVLPNLYIGEWAVLGAGAVAIRDIDPGSVEVGVPSHRIHHDDHLAAHGMRPRRHCLRGAASGVYSTFIGPSDPRWPAILARTPHDFYHLPGYAIVSGKCQQGSPVAFYAEDSEAACLIPLLLKRLPECLDVPKWWCDLSSPYGYPAPLFTHSRNHEGVQRFLNAFLGAADDIGACSVFLRQHPLFGGSIGQRLPLSADLELGETVSICLTQTYEQMWKQVRKGHRNDIRRLEKLGFVAVMDDWNLYAEFIQMYQQTMLRLGADPIYYFSSQYFHDLRAALGDRLHLCCVVSASGRVAAGGLFTVVNDIVEYYLSGSNPEFQTLAPSKLMLHFMSLWGKQHGCSLLHLGGGVGSRVDALFQFKAGFSPDRHPFTTSRIIVNEHRYAVVALRAGLSLDLSSDLRSVYFPQYRRVLSTNTAPSFASQAKTQIK